MPVKTTVLLSFLEDNESSSVPFISCLGINNLLTQQIGTEALDVEDDSILLMPGDDSI